MNENPLYKFVMLANVLINIWEDGNLFENWLERFSTKNAYSWQWLGAVSSFNTDLNDLVLSIVYICSKMVTRQ